MSNIVDDIENGAVEIGGLATLTASVGLCALIVFVFYWLYSKYGQDLADFLKDPLGFLKKILNQGTDESLYKKHPDAVAQTIAEEMTRSQTWTPGIGEIFPAATTAASFLEKLQEPGRILDPYNQGVEEDYLPNTGVYDA